MKKCDCSEVKKKSKHPHLEPSCHLVYSFMSEEEIILDLQRIELHLLEHHKVVFDVDNDKKKG